MTSVSALAFPFLIVERYYMKITKEKAVEVAIREGKFFKSKLAGTVLLIIYRDRADNLIKELEIEFYPHHYQHLTGLKLMKIDNVTGKQIIREHTSKEFYHRCVGKPYITPKEIMFVDASTIDLKMEALPLITQITKITKMTGDFDGRTKINLECDYLIGGENSCVGISRNTYNDRYFPRSCLKENIKKITKYTSQVIAIFQKNVNDKDVYKDIRYVAKGIDLSNINFPEDIKNKISLENYIYPKNSKQC